jgi:3-oxoacyl-[acyl-carrier protein] reductase
MENKVVLITGASRGIGASIAKKMASKNYDVVINYKNSQKEALALKEEIIKEYNVKVETIKADVSNEEDVKKMIEKIIDKFGKLNCLVNNAGIAIDCSFEDKTVDNFQKILNTNLIGPFLTSKYAYKYLEKEINSSIINISSTNGIDTIYPESMDYDASKSGLISLTKNLALQLAPKVRVNAICPGWVKTDMTKNLEKHYVEEETKKILLERFGNPDEIANVVLFLASDDATYINSEVIRVDGGFYS